MNRITNQALGKIVAHLRASLTRWNAVAEAESHVGAIAAHKIMLDVQTALDAIADLRMDLLRDELAAALPPIAGGAPDDGERWPADYSDDLDGFRWEPTWDGPLPIEVLATDEPTFEPSDSDWDDYFAIWSSELTEADHIAVHGCV